MPGLPPTVSGLWVDSIQSCNYSSFADKLLLQSQTSLPPSNSAKRFRQTQLTYASATKSTLSPVPPIPSTIDINSIHEKLSNQLSQQLSETVGPHLAITSLQEQVQQTSNEITNIKDTLEDKIKSVNKSVDILTCKVDNQ